MLDLIKRFEVIKNKKKFPFMPGSIENVFIYNDKCSKNEDGSIPVCIKLEPVIKKNKHFIN